MTPRPYYTNGRTRTNGAGNAIPLAQLDTAKRLDAAAADPIGLKLIPGGRSASIRRPGLMARLEPLVDAKSVDGELRQDWWKLYDDPVLNRLIEQAMAANPHLQAAAERFVQAHDVMIQDRSQYLQ
jgi:outer membrane protein TolC